jgi:hypothetical protein
MTSPAIDPTLLVDVVSRDDLESFFNRCFYELHPSAELEEAWHIGAMVHRLEGLAKGEIDRLLVTLPPRHLKSEIGSVAYTAWLLGRDPSVKILCTSYGQDLADKFHADVRRIMNSAWYARVFPKTVRALRRQTSGTIKTAMGGCRDATTLGGAITGFGYDYLIIDDPLKADEVSSQNARDGVIDLYQRTLQPRIEDKRVGRIVVLMQRLHENDLAGHIIRTGTATHLNLPAIATRDEIIPLNRGRVHSRRIGDLLSPIDVGAIDPAAAAAKRVNDPAQHAAIIHARLTAHIGRQKRLDPRPLSIGKPKEISHITTSSPRQ